MDTGLAGQTVLVTGSSSGIGRATAVAFGSEGARVAVTYHQNRSGAEETAHQVTAAGGQALVLPYDLADRQSIRACIEAIRKEWNALHVLVNNAVAKIAPPTGQPFENVPLEQWESMLRSSLEGVVLTTQCVLPMMRAGGWGRIVNVSSDVTDGWPGLGPYATAKAGLHGLTKTLAVELGPDGILSNIVMPGFVLTEHNLQRVPPEQREQIRQHLPTRQLVMPQDVAAAIVFLGSRLNRQITGEIIRVTGGR
ncbi:MAG TPA: SDR family NAD(P)-dependent oxidoreductase [Anaerolineae bacterium]|jgi:3-oxoacyl-[acyl-carrier protein] reductase